MLEKDIEQKSRDTVARAGGWLVKLTWINGIPDRMVLAPPGIIFFCEFKQPRGARKSLQSSRIRRLKRMGFCGYIIDNHDEFVRLFNRFQIAAKDWEDG